MGKSKAGPELERLMQEAAKKPRDFEAVLIHSLGVLGTPDEAQNAAAKFKELGIEVLTAIGGTSPYGWEGQPGRLVSWMEEDEAQDLTKAELQERA